MIDDFPPQEIRLEEGTSKSLHIILGDSEKESQEALEKFIDCLTPEGLKGSHSMHESVRHGLCGLFSDMPNKVEIPYGDGRILFYIRGDVKRTVIGDIRGPKNTETTYTLENYD